MASFSCRRVGKVPATQDGVQAELLPELVSGMHRARLPRLLDLNLVSFDGDRRWGRGGPLLPLTGSLAHLLDLGGQTGQRGLPLQGGLDFMRQPRPVFGRRRFQAAQRTEGALAWASESDRLDQQVIGVGFAFVDAGVVLRMYISHYKYHDRKSMSIYFLLHLVTIVDILPNRL